ncbi:MAG: AAA family ATPase, partial [Clostridia bacterium]|nr:AAA family ATPase [Clostridia bacterium]MBR3002148.1 AAA family ATPase [Clostridia bacterium]
MNNPGLGISDFKMLRLQETYFVDKSLFIKNIIDSTSSVSLITRPRRFGKTLNMSML